MLKVIKLSRYVFKEGIQHNVVFSISGLFDNEEDLAKERIFALTTLLESLCPNTITIASLSVSARPVSDAARSLKPLMFSSRNDISEGKEITLEQLKDVMLYCYSNGLELELDVLDIKNQHVTVVVNKDIQGFHFIYGTPETFTKEYLDTIKKKLKGYTFDGSFRKTL